MLKIIESTGEHHLPSSYFIQIHWPIIHSKFQKVFSLWKSPITYYVLSDCHDPWHVSEMDPPLAGESEECDSWQWSTWGGSSGAGSARTPTPAAGGTRVSQWVMLMLDLFEYLPSLVLCSIFLGIHKDTQLITNFAKKVSCFKERKKVKQH